MITEMDERFVRLCRAIEQADDMPSLRELAALAGMSESYVQRRFKAEIGVSPKAYAQAVKRERLRAALKTAANATRAIYDAGLSSPSQAYDKTREPLGMTPAVFARGGESAHIVYAIVPSSIGLVLVAATQRGICRVDIGETGAELEERLKQEFARARLVREDDSMTSTTSLIVAYLAGEGPWPLLPVDVRGTAFQTRVWEALRTIAPGSRVTYSELARLIGSPASARAVAQACASNKIALLVPCHRIVPRAGGTGGYRWDPKRKEQLLELERRLPHD